MERTGTRTIGIARGRINWIGRIWIAGLGRIKRAGQATVPIDIETALTAIDLTEAVVRLEVCDQVVRDVDAARHSCSPSPSST